MGSEVGLERGVGSRVRSMPRRATGLRVVLFGLTVFGPGSILAITTKQGGSVVDLAMRGASLLRSGFDERAA